MVVAYFLGHPVKSVGGLTSIKFWIMFMKLRQKTAFGEEITTALVLTTLRKFLSTF